MKSLEKYIKRHACLILLLCFSVLFDGCKKVDDHTESVLGQPFVTTAGYQSSVLVGDTITLKGKLFIDQGGYINIGNIKANIISDQKSKNADGSVFDNVRIVITASMGLGSNIPVTLVTNGQTISFPPISIRQYQGIPQKTDTTLFVEKIAAFNPNNIADYNAENLDLYSGSSVAADGTIYFDNPIGIFKISSGQVQSIITPGMSLKDNSGNFLVSRIMGSAISYDGNTLTFSASVQDNTDTVNNYVFKLCQMNVATHSITTLNRTLMVKGTAAQDGTPGAFEGTATQLKIIAMHLRTDVNGNIYFKNCYSVETPNASEDDIYNGFLATGHDYALETSWPYTLSNICRLSTNGKVTSLFSLNSPYYSPLYNIPGYKVQLASDYKISPDGATAYVYDQQDFVSHLSLLAYDLSKNVPLNNTGLNPKFRFTSYDTNSATAFPTGQYLNTLISVNFSNGDYSLEALPNGTILTNNGVSIAALDIVNKFAFNYAGTETGLLGGAPPSQDKEVGRAQNVAFSNMVFCGVDRAGAIYYTLPPAGQATRLTNPPLTFYKIYSKK
jgi:hypothetical protein